MSKPGEVQILIGKDGRDSGRYVELCLCKCGRAGWVICAQCFAL